MKDLVEGKDYIIIEVTCIVCGADLKPNTCEFELWRLGYAVCLESVSPSCVAALAMRLKREHGYA